MHPEQIKYTELTFQLIVESSPHAIVLVNKEGKIAYINSQTERLFGYLRGELIGQRVEQLIPERYKAQHPGFREMFFHSPAVRSMGAGRELYAQRKDLSEFPIEIGLNPVVTVDGTLVLASIIDITERKKAEEQFRLVVESAPNAMVLVNHEGVIALVNNQTEKLFGYHRSELMGKKLEILIPQRFSKEHPQLRENYFSNPRTRAMGAGRDLFALKKEGTEIQVEIGLNPIETAQGQMVLASIIDITERKVQESTLKKQLELEIRNKELEQFAYIASHDLQEPLRTVSNYMKVFEEDYLDLLDENARNYLESVNNATRRMSILIKSLLEFSRLGHNKKLTCLDIRSILNDVLADLETMISNSGAIIEISDMPIMNVYETEIRQLFQNLLTNSIKFQPKNSIPKVTITSQSQGDKWKFYVSDNGIGIKDIYFSRLFDIFQRLHTHHEYEGNGIGLANCKKIVELHQGEIGVQSQPGKGTTIHFTISNHIQ